MLSSLYYQSFLNKALTGWMLNWDVQYLSRTEKVLCVSWDFLYIIHLMQSHRSQKLRHLWGGKPLHPLLVAHMAL